VSVGLNKTLRKQLQTPVDVASVAVFRIVYGLLCCGLCLGFLFTPFIDEWLASCSVAFHWQGLEWVELPCDPTKLRVLLAIASLAGLGVAFGAFYKFSAILLESMLVYALLAEQAIYSSTYYLLCLFGFWLIFAPADRAWSIDARRKRITDPTGPGWPLLMLRFHVVVMYVYAAIAKLDWDWLTGRPIEIWLAESQDLPLIGSMLQTPGVAVFLSWGGLVFDALVVPLIVWKKTRAPTLAVVIFFHLFNSLVFEVFPLPILAVIATLLLLEPDWPRRLLARARKLAYASATARPARPLPGWLPKILAAYVAFHLLVPFRHLAYPGPVNWNEDGDEFSWRLRVRAKSKRLRIRVIDVETGRERRIKLKAVLHWQKQEAVRMYPDRLLQYAYHLADVAGKSGREVEVRVRYRAGLNGRERRDLIPPDTDLAKQERTFLNTAWLLPFVEE
jgi:hypothetical protein